MVAEFRVAYRLLGQAFCRARRFKIRTGIGSGSYFSTESLAQRMEQKSGRVVLQELGFGDENPNEITPRWR